MIFSYGWGRQQNWQLQKMQANWRWFRSPCRHGNTAQCTLPDGVHLWLHAKPLDAAIRRVPALYCPGSCHGQRFWMKHKNTNKTQFLPSFLMADDTKKLNSFGTQNRPSTHVINATSCIEMWSTTIWAEELSYIKRSQWTKIWKVISLEWSQKKPVGQIWPTWIFRLY